MFLILVVVATFVAAMLVHAAPPSEAPFIAWTAAPLFCWVLGRLWKVTAASAKPLLDLSWNVWSAVAVLYLLCATLRGPVGPFDGNVGNLDQFFLQSNPLAFAVFACWGWITALSRSLISAEEVRRAVANRLWTKFSPGG